MKSQSDTKPPIGSNSSDVEELTDEGLAAYVFDALVIFRQIASGRNMDFLTYLLDMAAQEAHALSGQESLRIRKSK